MHLTACERRGMDTLGYLSTLDAEVRDRLTPWAGRIPAALLGRCSLVKLDKGDELVHELDRFGSVYVLTRGAIASTSPLLDGGTYVIDEFQAPAAFGEMEAIGASPFYVSAKTVSRSIASLAERRMACVEGRKIVIDRETFELLEDMLRDELGQSAREREGSARS